MSARKPLAAGLSVSRRAFLKASGLGIAGAGLAGSLSFPSLLRAQDKGPIKAGVTSPSPG